MELTTNKKLVIDVVIILLLNFLLFLSVNRSEWFRMESKVFLSISVLYILFCLMTFVTGRIYSIMNTDKKSVFIFVLGVMILKTIISIGLVIVLFGMGKLSQKGEIFPILSIYIIYTYLIIKFLRAIDK